MPNLSLFLTIRFVEAVPTDSQGLKFSWVSVGK